MDHKFRSVNGGYQSGNQLEGVIGMDSNGKVRKKGVIHMKMSGE